VPLVVRAWILLSALLVGTGWILSAFGELNRAGYGIVFALVAGILIWWQRKIKWPSRKFISEIWRQFLQRFKRPAPLVFLALALLSLTAGALYFPSNKDSVQYRIPRVLHWLAQGQWHWIHTADFRMNIAGAGFEWLSAPLILFTRTDRFLFLISWFSFLMLPGLIFSVFTRLGVRPRVAWWWMWILPSGWCFISQAGSTINDSFAAIYALAAVDFALRARENKRASDVWFSMLAVALLTGVKQTVIPLALLWFIAIWPGIRLLLKRSIVSMGIILGSLLVSGLPMMILDLKHTGNWMGMSEKDPSWASTQLHSPVWGIIGNTFCLAAQNFKPPVFPWVNAWNAAMQNFLHTPFGAHFAQFESFGRLSLGVGESNAGIGSGICLLILISIWAARRYRTVAPVGATTNPDKLLWLLRWTPWALLLLFMAKIGTFENARQLAPYYIFLFPSLLVGAGYSYLTRRPWWRWLVLSVMCLAALLLLISRDRPLFPAQTIIGWLQQERPDSKFVARIAHSYSGTPDSGNQRIFLRTNLPPDEPVIGYATIDGMAEPAMWLPFGRRRVERVLASDTSRQLLLSGINYVVVEENIFRGTNDNIQQWLSRYDAITVKEWTFLADPYQPPNHFYLVRLRQPSE
jgi:hypothetical protein